MNNDAVASEHAQNVRMGIVSDKNCVFTAPASLNGYHDFSMPVGTGCDTQVSVEIIGTGNHKVGKLVYSNQLELANPASYGNADILPLFTQNVSHRL